MAFLHIDEHTQIYFEDRGSGRPVVLIHGWPLAGGSWEKQSHQLLAAGFRVITYDRRGFGRSSAPVGGYDYDTMTGDLAALMAKLQLQDATLVGFSMGGGDVARYMGKFGGKGVAAIVLISSVTPALGHAEGNPDGVDMSDFAGIKAKIEADRYAFLTGFFRDFYNKKLLGGSHISDEAVQASWNVASTSSYSAMLKTIDAWTEDFRTDLAAVKVPTLVVHGDGDQIVPFANSGKRIEQFVPHALTHVIEGGPHGILWTHATNVNQALLKFLT